LKQIKNEQNPKQESQEAFPKVKLEKQTYP
jgi:hypothetical protein